MRSFTLTLMLMCSFPVIADGLYRRDLDCEQQPDMRAKTICQALEQSLEWTWTGHAIISPSYRVSTERVRDVYCRLPVTADDTETLIDMTLNSELKSGMRYLQINIGAHDLLSMLGQQALQRFPVSETIPDTNRRRSIESLKQQIALAIAEDSPSIFNPAHRFYILSNGCQ